MDADEQIEEDIDVNEGLTGEERCNLLTVGRRQRQQYINNNFN